MGWARCSLAGGSLITLLALAGCGAHDGTVEVKGTVTLDSAPLQTGAIRFVPVDRKTKTAGGPITAGMYSVRVPVGTMEVSISSPKIVGKKKLYDTPDSREMDVTEEVLPARYNEETELRLEVPAGGVEKNWDLKNK
jgi:hypothetical protein